MTATEIPARPRNLQEELGKHKPFDLPQEEAYLNLIRTAEQFSDHFRAFFADFGLSQPQYNVLRIVAARGDKGIPSQAIAEDMVTRDPDMTRLVDRLEKAGLVIRHRCAEDRRRIWVRITPEGKNLLRKLDKPLQELLNDQLGHMSPTSLSKLSALLFEARHPGETDA